MECDILTHRGRQVGNNLYIIPQKKAPVMDFILFLRRVLDIDSPWVNAVFKGSDLIKIKTRHILDD